MGHCGATGLGLATRLLALPASPSQGARGAAKPGRGRGRAARHGPEPSEAFFPRARPRGPACACLQLLERPRQRGVENRPCFVIPAINQRAKGIQRRVPGAAMSEARRQEPPGSKSGRAVTSTRQGVRHDRVRPESCVTYGPYFT